MLRGASTGAPSLRYLASDESWRTTGGIWRKQALTTVRRKVGVLETLRVLITVKASPAISQRYGEVVCVAGIDIDKYRWTRLWPIHFGGSTDGSPLQEVLDHRAVAEKASDPRPESHTSDNASIRILGRPLPARKSKKRRALIEPLKQASMCRIIALQQSNKTPLGIFRPSELIDFRVEADAEN